MSLSRLLIGAADEALARAQAEAAAATLRTEFSHLEVSLVTLPRAATRVKGGSRGRTAEEMLLRGEVDVLVQPTEDLAAAYPEGLVLGAILRRATPFDVLLSRGAETLDELPHGSRVIACSLRRRGQLAQYRSDLELVESRGKLDRWRRELDAGACRGVVVEAAAIEHLGWQELVGEILSPGICLPAPGQGGLALMARQEAKDVMRTLRAVNNPGTWSEVMAEMSVLWGLEATSASAVGALAHVSGSRLMLEGVVVGSDDGDMARLHVEGDPAEPHQLGADLAERLLALGAGDLLRGRGGRRGN